jgi:hypothetical protein
MKRQRRTSPSESDGSGAVKPPATNRAFSALLKILYLNQHQAAEALAMEPNTLSDYAHGKTLTLDNYRRKCAALGLKPATSEHALALVAEVDGDEQLRRATSPELTSEIGRLVERLAASIPARARELATRRDRKRLQILWGHLKTLEPAAWRLLLAAAPDLRRWVLVKLVGEESAWAAADDTNRALDLASLALWVSERITGEEGWISRIFGFPGQCTARGE